jgi:hypothetical protein
MCQCHQTILRFLSTVATASTRWQVHELYCQTQYNNKHKTTAKITNGGTGSSSGGREWNILLLDHVSTDHCMQRLSRNYQIYFPNFKEVVGEFFFSHINSLSSLQRYEY